ncbi:alpha/beta hydrolase [Aeoliella mucimassa]|uniref:Acetylxylan esterase n=1 Tax=Aeoliella mucimassa TaxID=2527972 RepID=A0A518ATP4_9BACT|nr:alpha/beta hydrolase [Aeoliella mucimassa]QDU58101.1 Acetylxylan esterase precursor [Aeoliella mucimassa]
MLRTGALIMAIVASNLALAQSEMPLWPEGHPANQGEGPAVTEPSPNRLVVHYAPSMIPKIPENHFSGASVLILPGGGYGVLAIDHEGYDVADWLAERGIASFILKYRCGGGQNQTPAPLDDAKQAMRLIRANAKEWGLNPNRIGVIGFSAGGHLASSVSTLWDEGNPEAENEVERLSSRPDFSMLIYPVISMEAGVTHSGSRRKLLGDSPSDELSEKFTTYKQVNDRTPPTFLAHASDDRGVLPENSIRYFQALLEHKVPAELHMYEKGGHGFGMKTLDTFQNQWLTDLEIWLKPRVAPSSELSEVTNE